MSNPTVIEIISAHGQLDELPKDTIREYLEDNNFDGLSGEECGCCVVDLAPCDCTLEEISECVAGYANPAPEKSGYQLFICHSKAKDCDRQLCSYYEHCMEQVTRKGSEELEDD